MVQQGGVETDDPIIVALGGNLPGDGRSGEATIEAAIDALPSAGLKVIRRSRLWRSAAWPNPADPPFLNAVVLVTTSFGPKRTLSVLHELEARFGRSHGRPNAPRTLDLDLIAYRRLVRCHDPLLPHPRAAERLFVMGPLAEIAPDWRHPIIGERAEVLAQHASVGRDARPCRIAPVKDDDVCK